MGLDSSHCTPQESGTLTCDEVHQPRGSRGCAKKDSKLVFSARLPNMDTPERKRARDAQEEGSEGAGKRMHV